MIKSSFRIMRVLILTVLLAVLLAACDNSDGDGDNGVIYQGSDYYPLEIGNTWVYNLGTVQVLDETRTFSGGTGQRVENATLDCCPYDIFITHSDGDVVICGGYHRDDELYFEFPVQGSFVLLSKEMRIGDSWVVDFDETTTITFNFLGVETVTVPAGTFSDSLKISVDVVDRDTAGTYTEISWYAKNVGQIKAERIAESPSGYSGCMKVPPENPFVELQSALINSVTYP